MFFNFNKFISFLFLLTFLFLFQGFAWKDHERPRKKKTRKAKKEAVFTKSTKITKYDLEIIDIIPLEILMEVATVENLEKDLADALDLKTLMQLEVNDDFGKDIIAANP